MTADITTPGAILLLLTMSQVRRRVIFLDFLELLIAQLKPLCTSVSKLPTLATVQGSSPRLFCPES